jgi:antitoxin ParD1/3/4
MTHSPPDDIYNEAARRRGIKQAKALRDQAKAGGLRFQVYLPGGLCEWLLDQIEQGVFVDPSEAVFVMLTEQRDLEPHADLREEILRRSCQAAIDDPRRIPHEEVVERMRALTTAPRRELARWRS